MDPPYCFSFMSCTSRPPLCIDCLIQAQLILNWLRDLTHCTHDPLPVIHLSGPCNCTNCAYVPGSKRWRVVQVTRSPVFSHFAESLAGMDTIRAYGYQDRFAAMNDDRVDHNHRSSHALYGAVTDTIKRQYSPRGASGGAVWSHLIN